MYTPQQSPDFGAGDRRASRDFAAGSAAADSARDAFSDERAALDAGIAYAHAYREKVAARFDVARAEVRLGLVRLIGALLGALVTVVLLIAAWILAMVGVASLLADSLAYPGANVLILALVNVAAAAGFYVWAGRAWRKAWAIRPLQRLFQ